MERTSRGRQIGIFGVVALSLAIFAALTVRCFAGSAEDSQPRSAKANNISLSPMGWSSWNSFSNTVDSDVVVQQTQALISTGMKKAGYRYINIDEGWWLGKRDRQGNIVVDPKQWPALDSGDHAGDMSNIVRYIHSAGMKAGIYTDAGEAGCSFYGPDLGPAVPHTGSEGHYDQDFLQFAQWGFDYVKVDWCGGNIEKLDPAVQYAEIVRAISRAEKITGHRLYYSICNWGAKSPWTWAPGIGGVRADIWRTSGDIVAPIVAGTPNSTRQASFTGVLSNFDQGIHNEAQHTGYYNDPDMMVIGMPGLSETQNRIHMLLWAISGAPLIVGADLTKLDDSTKAILTNERVIAVDQDPLGLQAIMVAEPHPGLQIWVKPLAGVGDRAVLLLNRTGTEATLEASWEQIGLDAQSPARVQDLSIGKELESSPSGYAAPVPAGDAVLLKINGKEGRSTQYVVSTSGNRLHDGKAPEECTTCRDGRPAAIGDKKSVSFDVALLKGVAVVRVSYVNPGRLPLIVQLKVDGKTPTNVLLPPTSKKQQIGGVACEVESTQSGPSSNLSFSWADAPGAKLKSITVQTFGEQ